MLKVTVAIAVMVMSLWADVAISFPFGGNSVASHCKDLTPSHSGIASQTGIAPYTVTVNATTGYVPQQSYRVTIQATNATAYPVHGFIIQFRNYNNLTTRGVFTQWNSSTSVQGDCDRLQDTITHFNPAKADLPESISFTWTAPAAGSGPLRIWSSFVSSYSVFWVRGFVSAEIPELGGAPFTTQQTPTGVTVDLGTCGTSKGCYRYPSTCTSQATCNYIYTQRTGTAGGTPYVEVELSTTNPGWAAIGYSVDKIMGGSDSPPDDVLACQNSGGSVSVKNGYIIVANGGRFHTNDNDTDLGQGMTALGASFSSGILACRFRRNLYTSSQFDKDLRDAYHQFYVWDPTLGGDLSSLPYHATNAPIVSATRVLANDTSMGLGAMTTVPPTTSGSTAVVVNVAMILVSPFMMSTILY